MTRASLAGKNSSQSLLPVLQTLVHNRYPQVIGRDLSSIKISVEGEDMLFALLGGQVDQRGIAPTQGNLMNPPLQYPDSQSSQPLAPLRQQNHGSHSTSTSPIVPSQGPKSLPPPAPPHRLETQNQPFLPMGYDPSIWNAQMMALPVVAPLPSASASEPFHQSMYQDSIGQQRSQAQYPQIPQLSYGDANGEFSNEDLWARLQTFYEPTPAYWGQSVQGVQPGYQMDYSGMAMGL